jgi:hypothetical protein
MIFKVITEVKSVLTAKKYKMAIGFTGDFG